MVKVGEGYYYLHTHTLPTCGLSQNTNAVFTHNVQISPLPTTQMRVIVKQTLINPTLCLHKLPQSVRVAITHTLINSKLWDDRDPLKIILGVTKLTHLYIYAAAFQMC